MKNPDNFLGRRLTSWTFYITQKIVKNPREAFFEISREILWYGAGHLAVYQSDICQDTSNTLVNLIFGFCKSFRYNTFLEIGTFKGYTSLSIHKLFTKEFKKSVVYTVDPEILNNKLLDYKGNKSHVFRFFNQKSDDYFVAHDEKFDFILIDGDHSYEAMKKDFQNSVKASNKNGTILLHDPISAKGVCNFFVKHIQNNKNYNHLIFPYHVGYVIIQKNDDGKYKKFLERHPNKHVKDVKFIDLNHYT